MESAGARAYNGSMGAVSPAHPGPGVPGGGILVSRSRGEASRKLKAFSLHMLNGERKFVSNQERSEPKISLPIHLTHFL